VASIPFLQVCHTETIALKRSPITKQGGCAIRSATRSTFSRYPFEVGRLSSFAQASSETQSPSETSSE
jgi:hypothetical protein